MSEEALDNKDHPTYESDQPLPDSLPAKEPYTPVFDANVRTAVYVVCAIAGVILTVAAPVAIEAGAAKWLTILLSSLAGAIPTVAAAFGVAYNPSRSIR